MSTTPVIIALAVVTIAAWAWHAVTEHHVHRKLLARVRRGVIVPQTRHDAWWHGMSHVKRLGVSALLLLAAMALGLSWQLERTAATAAAIIIAVAVAGLLAARRVGRAIGERHRPEPGED